MRPKPLTPVLQNFYKKLMVEVSVGIAWNTCIRYTGAMAVYYNENNKFNAQWLRELITKGAIGDVDESSIEDVKPADLSGYTQCHFFAGIGTWSYVLRRAPDDRQVWTGSCPCQPYSKAG